MKSSPLKLLPYLLSFLLMVLVNANCVQAQSVTVEQNVSGMTGLSIVGDPLFKVDKLSPEMKIWYNRLLESMTAAKSYVDYNAQSGNEYRMRTVNEYVSSMLAALRATGDLRFLKEAIRVTDMTWLKLKDARELPDPALPGANTCDGTRDGYLSWLQLEYYPKTGYNINYPYFCTDDDPMEEAMSHGLVAAMAYALHMNRNYNLGYAKRADFWTNYLENHFMAKWTKRMGGELAAWSGIEKRLAHPISSLVRISYYLYKITGKPIYLDRANYYTGMLVNLVTINPQHPTAFIWKHNVWGADEGYQRINYAEYFMMMVLEMSAEKFGNYYPDADMQKYASTFRDVVFPVGEPTFQKMAYRVDGSGTDTMNVYCMSGFGRWDSTGYILNVANKTYTPGNYMTAAYALYALSNR